MAGEGEQDSKANGPLKPFFSGGGEDSTASYAHTDIAVGTEVGPFKVCGVLGEGGYGIVYLAEQERPIRRRVALKIVKPGMDSRQVVARFEAERQALALLDHPNIAQIHDAGTTPAGRPYFAMEYIEGLPITEYCDRERLDLKERLRLFLQVCAAVEHAHQKGIIHRDLKPSNILVTIKEGTPLVKIIDFGIAKALSQTLTERTLHTEQGDFLGTPDYMSPEQVRMDRDGVDTRSDVYSLGVLLYELLTGVLPFDPDALRAGGAEHMHAVIREQEPRTPSTRLGTLGATLSEIAERRRTDSRALTMVLRRELEWIPLKAMRKEPSRRYQSASELERDIENYLTGEPLLAAPESMLYLAGKFARRHRVAVGAAMMVAASLVIGLIVSMTMYFRAERMRIFADNSRQTAEAAQVSELAQRRIAEQERDRAITAGEDARRRIVDLYEEQGRRYMESGDMDRALVLLAEALKSDGARVSTRLLAEEALRRHPDPNFHRLTSLIAWKDEVPSLYPCFATNPDRTLIAIAAEGDPVVRILDTETGEPRIRFHAGDVARLAFVPGGQYVLAQTEDTPSRHAIAVFDLGTGQCVMLLRRANVDIDTLMSCQHGILPPRHVMERAYKGILVSPAGDWLAFLDADTSADAPESWVVFCDLSNHRLQYSARFPAGRFLVNLVFRPPSAYGHPAALVAVDRERTIYFWDVPRFAPTGEGVMEVVGGIFAGTRMILLNLKGEAELLDRAGNRGIRTIPQAIAFGFNSGSSRFVTRSSLEPISVSRDNSGNIATDIWDSQDGEHIARLDGATTENWYFSPDGRFLVTEHHDGAIRIWLAEDGTLGFEIPPDKNQEVADISPDSRWLVTRSHLTPSVVMVWNLATGEFFCPYASNLSWRDIGAGWLMYETDPVFAWSERPPGFLPRFNRSGSALISPRGLLPVHTDASTSTRLVDLVTTHIDLRVENGRIRATSQEEKWLARLNSCRASGEEHSVEAIDCLLNLMSLAVARNDLTEAMTFLQQYTALLPVDNAELADRGSTLARELSSAWFRNGDREERCGRYNLAVDNYRQALRVWAEDPTAWHRLAWILATCPDRSLRDAEEAVRTAERACELENWHSWEAMYTFAVACAARGRFADAVRMQSKALELLPASEKERWAENLRECLRLFEANQPYDWRHLCNLPDRNMLCWWAFDDLEGPAVRDRSGLGHKAELFGEHHLLTEDGHTVLQLSGEEASIRCANTHDLKVVDSLTVAAWVKYSPGDKGQETSQQTLAKGHAWGLGVSYGTCTPFFRCAGLDVPASAPDSRVKGKTSLDDGRWHHLAGVYDSQALSLYVDGTLDTSVGASGSLATTDEELALFWSTWNYIPWRGWMREARVYDRAFSKEEIAYLFEASK